MKPGKSQTQRAQIQEKDKLSNSRVGEKAVNECGLNCGHHTCLLTNSISVSGLLWSMFRPPKCPEIKILPDISPSKMGLFWISRELQFGVCNHGEPSTSSCTAREGEHFHRDEKEVGRVLVNKEFMAFHWLSPCQERTLLPVGLCYHHRS